MSVQDQLPLPHGNQYAADAPCVHCEGVIHHESWCATHNACVHYAYEAVLNPNSLSLEDYLVLHALGVSWAEGLVEPLEP
jgi:hypothetical protein